MFLGGCGALRVSLKKKAFPYFLYRKPGSAAVMKMGRHDFGPHVMSYGLRECGASACFRGSMINSIALSSVTMRNNCGHTHGSRK